ncbi:MAG: hypothetical protein EOP09_16900 [Proteobacteria bacterium]|nr:MAG: hypothetical protein EOP09_16900 [Pseudomonadota bacterium]
MAINDLTFSQMEGMTSLPEQLKLRELSQELRAKVWFVVYAYLKDGIDDSDYNPVFKDNWARIVLWWHVHHEHKFADDFRNVPNERIAEFKAIIANSAYNRVFDLLQFIARHPVCPRDFEKNINQALENSRAAYRIVDKTVVPVTSEEDTVTVVRAFEAMQLPKFAGAKSHLRAAAEALSSGDYPSAVRESIHAVESAARILEPSASTLGPALAALEKSGALHGSMKQAFGALYGYTSDEKGIRHALLDKAEASVDEADALYMFGACSAFLTYLAKRAP